MANPRTRRAARSGKGPVRASRRQNTKLKKVDPRGPRAFVEAWDKTKTPRQNWETLGLLSGKLQPRLVGGVEKKLGREEYWVEKNRRGDEFELSDLEEAMEGVEGDAAEDLEEDSEDSENEGGDEDEDMEAGASTTAPTAHDPKLSKGEGRIIRDADGKILKIILGGDADSESETEALPTAEDDHLVRITASDKGKGKAKAGEATPWGAPLDETAALGRAKERKDNSMKPTVQGIPYSTSAAPVAAKTPLVAELERIASSTATGPVKRHTSTREEFWLSTLVQRYGDDTQKMARDRKLNLHQRTEGELKRMITKAGGVERLKEVAEAEELLG